MLTSLQLLEEHIVGGVDEMPESYGILVVNKKTKE